MSKKKGKKEPIKQLSALAAQYPGAGALRPPEPMEAEDHVTSRAEEELDDAGADPNVVENADGSADVFMDEDDVGPTLDGSDFDANLAEILPESVLSSLAYKYMYKIEEAIESRRKRDEMYEEGLKRAGLGEPAPGGAEFEGASRVTHPVLAEAYVDFSASAMKELFPPNGPVRTQIEGQVTSEKLDRAQRKCDYMNKQLTKEIPEYRSELEVLLTQLGAGGSQFLKVYWSGALGRIVVDFVGVDEFILPFNAKGFLRAPFKFHRLKKDEFDVAQDVASGLYRDVSVVLPSGFGDDSKTETQSQKIEGKEYNWGANDSGEFIFFEGTVYEDEFDDPKRPKGRQAPYILTIDEGSNKIVGLYRNWEEKDEKCEDIPYMVEFKFIPWRGAYGIGLPHLIGDLSAALTGTLRALLDSAHIQNSATAIKLKGRPGGETISASPTQVTEIDALAGDDIRKVIMPMSFNGPSPVLLQLLGFLQSAAKGVVSTAEEKIADAGNQMPMGTALALIEQGAKVYSSIHARLHESQRQALTIVHRLNYKHMPAKIMFGEDEKDFVTRDDFKGPLDIYPVSDPNIFSETQRFAQMQAVMAMAEKAPTIMDIKKCYERMLQLMKVPDYKELLISPPKPASQNPAAENVQMAMGKPAPAFPDQDHLAHLQVHLDFLKDPLFGMSTMMGRTIIPGMIEHVKQHMLFYYANLMNLEGKRNLGEDISKTVQKDKSWQTDRDVAESLAHSSPTVMGALKNALQGVPPVIEQATKFLQSQMPQPGQQDPNFILAMHELDQRKAEHTDDIQIEQQRLTQAMKKLMGDQQMRMQTIEQNMKKYVMQFEASQKKTDTEAATDAEATTVKAQTDVQTTEMNNDTAIEIAEMRGKDMKDGGSMTQH